MSARSYCGSKLALCSATVFPAVRHCCAHDEQSQIVVGLSRLFACLDVERHFQFDTVETVTFDYCNLALIVGASSPQTEQKNNIFITLDLDENHIAFDFCGIRFQIHASGRAFRLAGDEIKPAVVLGAFNEIVHDETTSQMDFRVRA